MALQAHNDVRADGRMIFYGDAFPTAATGINFTAGDTIINTSTSTSAQPDSWRCVSSGDPGGWEESVGTSVVQSVEATVTLVQLNAGLTLVAAQTGRTLKVVSFWMKIATQFNTATDIRISDTAASPVDVVTLAIANATDANIISEQGGTGITIGAGFGVSLTAAKGIQIRKTGSSATNGVSILTIVKYKVN